jgi:hypothetical protein
MVRVMQTEGCTVAILRDLIPFGGGTGEFEKDGVAIWISLLGSYVTGLLRTEPGIDRWSLDTDIGESEYMKKMGQIGSYDLTGTR